MGSLWGSGQGSHQPQPEESLNGAVEQRCARAGSNLRLHTTPRWSKARHEAEVGWACLGVREAPICLVQGHIPEGVSGMKVEQLQLP